MSSLFPNETRLTKTTGRLLIYALVNLFACYFIPHFLAWTHYVINGLFIPRRFFYSVTRPNQDMTPLYLLMLFIITAELAGLLVGMLRFNMKYSYLIPGQRSAMTARLITILIEIIVTSLTIKEFWYLLKKL